MKTCPKCKTSYEKPELFFHKDAGRKDGLTSMCKICRRHVVDLFKRRNRDARRYEKDKAKFSARNTAKDHFSAKDHKCSVLSCNDQATDLHHVDYLDPLSVIPLCRKHHESEHHK